MVITLGLLFVPSGRAFAADARGESSRTYAARIGLRYEAPSDCPGVDEYLAHVERRLGPEWENALRQFAERLEVTIVRMGPTYRGAVEFVDLRGERFSRAVSGSVCSEVVDGVSLITSLAVRARVSEPSDGSGPG